MVGNSRNHKNTLIQFSFFKTVYRTTFERLVFESKIIKLRGTALPRITLCKYYGLRDLQLYLLDLTLRKPESLSRHWSELKNKAQLKLGFIGLKSKACAVFNLPSRSGTKGASFTLTSYSTQTNTISKIPVYRGVTQINMTATK